MLSVNSTIIYFNNINHFVNIISSCESDKERFIKTLLKLNKMMNIFRVSKTQNRMAKTTALDFLALMDVWTFNITFFDSNLSKEELKKNYDYIKNKMQMSVGFCRMSTIRRISKILNIAYL